VSGARPARKLGAMIPGPVEVAVISFEGNRFKGEIAPALEEIVDRGIIRIVDLVFVTKDGAGRVRNFEVDDTETGAAGAMSPLAHEIAGLLSEDDIREIGERLQPNSSAAMIVFEHAWLRRLKEAILNANGRLVAQERIPLEVVERALAERAGV
jgi:uncharacterized membrane protein